MELVFLQRFTQGDFQNAAFLGMNMQLWFIRMMQPAAMFLRTVESKVSPANQHFRSEEHTSELQSLMRISYAVFCFTQKHHQCLPMIYVYRNNCNFHIPYII